MGKSNKEIIKKLHKVVFNGKNLDAIHDYYSEDFVSWSVPYIGIGAFLDPTSEDKVKVRNIVKGGPSDGKLQVGDEIVAAEDEVGKWDTVADLKSVRWGQGKIGTPVKVTLRRDGELVEVELTRDKIESYDTSLDIFIDNWKHFLTIGCPDLKVEIAHIIEEGDLVAVYWISTGTITEFERQAIWAGCTFSRFRDGRIAESWGVGPGIGYYTQLGYKVERPKP